MAQQVKLKAQKRTLVGRNAIKKIKQKGLVPGVIYGSQAEPLTLQIDSRELTNVLAHASSEHVLVELEIVDGVRVQPPGSDSGSSASPPKRELLHVDFHAVSATEKITQFQSRLRRSFSVRAFGGLLEYSLRTLEVECFPQDLRTCLDRRYPNGESPHVPRHPASTGLKPLRGLTVVLVVASRGEEVTETAEAPVTRKSQPKEVEPSRRLSRSHPWRIRLVAGWNPGSQYIDTRHNIGFMVTDCWGEKGVDYQDRLLSSDWGKWGDILLVKPLTMNRRGRGWSIRTLFQDPARRDLVVVDDLRRWPPPAATRSDAVTTVQVHY
jgi:large subunit ribosomal protein L25